MSTHIKINVGRYLVHQNYPLLPLFMFLLIPFLLSLGVSADWVTVDISKNGTGISNSDDAGSPTLPATETPVWSSSAAPSSAGESSSTSGPGIDSLVSLPSTTSSPIASASPISHHHHPLTSTQEGLIEFGGVLFLIVLIVIGFYIRYKRKVARIKAAQAEGIPYLVDDPSTAPSTTTQETSVVKSYRELEGNHSIYDVTDVLAWGARSDVQSAWSSQASLLPPPSVVKRSDSVRAATQAAIDAETACSRKSGGSMDAPPPEYDPVDRFTHLFVRR